MRVADRCVQVMGGTGVTGDVPAAWSIQRLSGADITAATTLRNRLDGKNGKELLLEVSSTATGQINAYGVATFADANAWASGVGIYTDCDVEFTPTSGDAYPHSYIRTTGTLLQARGLSNGSLIGFAKAFSGRMRTPILVSDGLSASLQGWVIEFAAAAAVFNVVRRNYVAYRYDKTAPGALTW